MRSLSHKGDPPQRGPPIKTPQKEPPPQKRGAPPQRPSPQKGGPPPPPHEEDLEETAGFVPALPSLFFFNE